MPTFKHPLIQGVEMVLERQKESDRLLTAQQSRLSAAEAELEELRARAAHFGQWSSAYKILLGNAVVLLTEAGELLGGHDELIERIDRFVIEAEGYK